MHSRARTDFGDSNKHPSLSVAVRDRSTRTEFRDRKQPSSLGKCQGYHKEAWLLRWDNDESKLGEDSSDPIKVPPGLNSGTSPRPCVCVLATEIFPKCWLRAREFTYCVFFLWTYCMIYLSILIMPSELSPALSKAGATHYSTASPSTIGYGIEFTPSTTADRNQRHGRMSVWEERKECGVSKH